MSRGPLLAVVTASLLFAAVYVELDFNQLFALRMGQNSGLYLQSLVELARHGTTFNQSDGRPHLVVHDQWLAFVVSPLIALWPSAKTLAVVQCIALAAAAPMLYVLGRKLGLSAANAALVACAYLLAPSTQGWAYHSFVPEDALPLIAFALAYAIAGKRFALALIAAELLLGIKEDEAYFLAWLGAFVAWRIDRRTGIAIVALALANGLAYYGIDRALGFAPEHPVYGASDPAIGQQLAFLAEILAPLAFAPLALGWPIVLVAPFAAELFLTQDRTYPLYQSGSYYTVPLVTLATIGAAVAIARRPVLARWCFGCAVVMALFFNPTVLHIGRHRFSVDPLYQTAVRIGMTDASVDFPCDDAGAWTVAASDVNARLACPGTAAEHVLDGVREPPRSGRSAWGDTPLDSHAAWTRF